MANPQYGRGHAETLSGALMELASGTFYAARINLQSAKFSVAGGLDEIKESGQIKSLIFSGDYLEAVFEVLPEAAASQSAAYQYGCSMPARGTAFNASGFGPVAIPLGPFTVSGINNSGSSPSPGTDTMPWFFINGELNAMSDGKWTASWTMRRYKNITSGTAVT